MTLADMTQATKMGSSCFEALDTAGQWSDRALSNHHNYLSGMTILRSLVSTTKMARSLAGAVSLALWLTW